MSKFYLRSVRLVMPARVAMGTLVSILPRQNGQHEIETIGTQGEEITTESFGRFSTHCRERLVEKL